jgi:hypothetical protein
MSRFLSLLSTVSLMFVLSCNSNPVQQGNDSEGAGPDTVAYELTSLRYESDLPVESPDTANRKTYFQASFPKFQDTVLNAYVRRLASFSYNPDIEYQTLEEAGKGFIQEFEDYQQLDYSSPWAWYKNIQVKVEENRPPYIGIGVHYDDFMGGAHGNYGIVYGNYHSEEKKELKLSDIIREDQLDSLNAIAEKIFMEREKLADNDFTNYFFTDDVFALNENFLLKEKSILFLYNVYEIKSYAEGITELEIPYTEIIHLMTPEARELLHLKE